MILNIYIYIYMFYFGNVYTWGRQVWKLGFRRALPRQELLIAACGKAGKVPTPYPRPRFHVSPLLNLATRAITSDLVPPRARGEEKRVLSLVIGSLSLPRCTTTSVRDVAVRLPRSVLAPRRAAIVNPVNHAFLRVSSRTHRLAWILTRNANRNQWFSDAKKKYTRHSKIISKKLNWFVSFPTLNWSLIILCTFRVKSSQLE